MNDQDDVVAVPSVEPEQVEPEPVVFDEPAAMLGLKLKPEFVQAAGNGAVTGKTGTIEIKPARKH